MQATVLPHKNGTKHVRELASSRIQEQRCEAHLLHSKVLAD